MAILTGGGDVPGLNPAIKAAVNRSTEAGIEMYGVRKGWAGLLNYNPDKKEPQPEWIRPITRNDVRRVLELARTYQRRKKPVRHFPAAFEPAGSSA